MNIPFVELRGNAPLHRQLYEGLKAAITDGRLGRGARLPASRRLAAELGVSRTVVVNAYDQLIAEGFVEGRAGSGTFVCAALSSPREGVVAAAEAFQPRWSVEGARLIAADSGRDDAAELVTWDFTVGQPRPGEFVDRFWRRVLGRELARGAYGPAAGAPELRRAVAAYLRSSRGVRCRWEDVLIVQGTRQALDLIARVLLDPEDVVALEEPHYPDARHAFAARGARFVAAPVDRAGLRVDELPEGEASAVYVTPSHHYPTGAVLSIERRHALLNWAARSGALVLEDDYDSEFRYGGRPIPALQGIDRDGRVIYLGSFSKVLSPDLRLGYVVASPPVARALAAAKRRADRQSPLFLQRAVAAYLTEGNFSRHLWRMRARYGKRRRALVGALRRILPPAVEVVSGRAGIQLLLRVTDAPPAVTPTLSQALLNRGVRLDAATDCYLGRAACAEFLLGFARHEPDELEEPLRIIADVLTDFRGRGWRAADAQVRNTRASA